MATATQQKRTKPQVTSRVEDPSEPGAITFVVLEDNAGEYRWSILDGRGETLAQSGTFATYDAAHSAAGVIRDGAGSSQFEPRPAGVNGEAVGGS